MLQDIRENAQGTIAKVIIVLLVLGLSAFGMEAIVGGFGGPAAVATVNGEEITEIEFERQVQLRRQQRLQQMERPDPSLIDEGALRKSVMDQMINERLLLQDARERGIALADRDVDELIRQIPQFQVDGQFSQDRFLSVVRSQGLGVAQFREMLRQDYMLRQVQLGIAASAFAPKPMVERLAALQQQTRSYRTLSLTADHLDQPVSVTPKEVQTYYENNKSQFQRPESVDVAYLVLDRDALMEQVEISDEEVRNLYEQRLESLEAKEERRAAHILIEPGEGAAEKIEAVEQALAEGAEFGELARKYSDDIGTASTGGDLGFVTRESFGDAFGEALFGIQSVGEVAGPVQSDYGTHFIKLKAVRTQEKPSFKDLEEKLRTELKRRKADRLYSEKSSELADIAYAADSLEEPAETVNLSPMTREGVTEEGARAPFDHGGLRRQLFSDAVLKDGYNTELVEVADGRSVVARVQAHHPARTLPLEAVREDIRKQLRRDKTLEALKAQADRWLKQLREGTLTPEELAEEVGSQWQDHEKVQRSGPFGGDSVRSAVFRLPRPDDSPVYASVPLEKEVVLVSLQQVQEGEIDQQPGIRDQLARILGQRLGSEAYRRYLDQLKAQADIERL